MTIKNTIIAGIDEAGRGPLAGPVIAAAVILNPDKPISELRDSKQLSARQRELIAVTIKAESTAWAIGRAEVTEIDAINILQASLLAMQRAVVALSVQPQEVLVDGNQCPQLNCPVKAIVRGDQLIPAISAASILAKVARDNEMIILDRQYPDYGFAQHKGYPTKMHREMLKQHGVSAIHRRSYTPVRECLSVSDNYV